MLGGLVPHAEDPPEERMKVSDRDCVSDRPVAQAKLTQLHAGRYPVLPLRQPRDLSEFTSAVSFVPNRYISHRGSELAP